MNTETLKYTDCTSYDVQTAIEAEIEILGPITANVATVSKLPVGSFIKSAGEANWFAEKLGTNRWSVYNVNYYGSGEGAMVNHKTTLSHALRMICSKLEVCTVEFRRQGDRR
jgi:hypothetical protein